MNEKPLAPTVLPPELESLVCDLYRKCGGEEFGLTQQQFIVNVEEVGHKCLAPGAGLVEIRELCLSLRVEELALARSCANGNDRAWEVFLLRYREKLYDMARHITGEDSSARDLADSLYAELYGVNARDGVRVSKLASYTGRGSLEGWLRTVLAQEHVNRYRRQKRLVSLEEEAEGGAQFAAPEGETVPAIDPRLTSATDAALTALSSEDRFVLASYYLDGRTLAEIARVLGVHESTISRKLDKLAKSLRKQIMTALMGTGMSRRQAQESLDVDVRDLRVDIGKRLVQDSASPAFPEKKVGAQAGDHPG